MNYKKLTPFKWYVLDNFPFIEADFDAITNYQLYSKVVEYLNKTIADVNLLGEKVEEISNYFDNLDVQEEINNKLDEMTESGELQEIIADYLNSKAIFGFDTVASLVSSTNLINGSYAKTLGYFEKNDGGSGLYKIRTITNDDVVDSASIIALNDDTLVAELIVENSIVNAKQFGLYGDNTHNDTTNLQKAITFCETNNYNLYIPKGNYYIDTVLSITGVQITGESSKNTILHLNNCDGIILKQYNMQNVCEISNVAFKSDTVNLEIAGVTYQKYDDDSNTRSRGYKLSNLYFYNLGCAIEIQDAFRNTLADIGINNCFRALFIKNQVVQCSFINIVANNDLDNSLTSTRFADTRNDGKSIGVQIGMSTENKRPEGIKLNQVCCTNYNLGCYMYDCLYFTATQCEFDLCQNQGVVVYAGSGGVIFDGCWIANKTGASNNIVDFLVSNTTAKNNPRRIINSIIYNLSNESNITGIYIGKNAQFGYNFGVIGCSVINTTNATLEYGIVSNKCKDTIIANDNVHGCSNQDIRIYTEDGDQLVNNTTEKIQATIYENKKLYAFGNAYTSKTVTNNGTLIGNFD